MEPVKLTSEQIRDILKAVPRPRGIGKTAVSIAHRHHQERLRDELVEIKLIPTQAALEEFKTTLIDSYRRAYAPAGLPAGIRGGVALGGPLSQLSLNTFHFVGALSGFAQAFQVVRDYLTGSKANRAPSMRIYFKRPGTGTNLHDVIHEGTFDSIITRRHLFEQTTVKDAVDRHEILSEDEARAERVPELLELQRKLRPQQLEHFETRFNYVLKLKLNTYRMYSRKITMKKLAEAIEGPSPTPDLITCVWRSQRDGFMYVLVDGSKDLGKEIIAQDHAVLIFLQQLIRKFGDYVAGGISGILAIEPTEVQVMDGIHRIVHDGKKPNEHLVFTTNRKTRWQGISLGDLRELFERAGFVVRAFKPDKLYIRVYYEGPSLLDELKRRIKMANEKPVPDRTPEEQALLKASQFHYANTRGANYRKLVWRSDLDLFRTVENDAHTIQDDLGIDAARVFLIFKFRQTLQRFPDQVNGRHIALIFDLLTNLGIINSLTFTGLNRRKIGTLPLASSERAVDTFVNSAFTGGKEGVAPVSSSIYVGQKLGQIGTGGVRVITDPTVAPSNRPILPSVDELTILTGVELTRELTLADLLQGHAPEPELSAEPVNHAQILQATQILSKGPPQEPGRALIPPGASLIQASRTIDRALEDLTVGTGIIIEPPRLPQASNPAETATAIGEVVDITEIVSLDELELIEPSRAVPTQATSLSELRSQVKVISNPTTLPREVARSRRHDPPIITPVSRPTAQPSVRPTAQPSGRLPRIVRQTPAPAPIAAEETGSEIVVPSISEPEPIQSEAEPPQANQSSSFLTMSSN